ncbi:uncharacterized protein LOC144342147 [Saccoglossus kowalevskii]
MAIVTVLRRTVMMAAHIQNIGYLYHRQHFCCHLTFRFITIKSSSINVPWKKAIINSDDERFLTSIGVDTRTMHITENSDTNAEKLVNYLNKKGISCDDFIRTIKKTQRIVMVNPIDLDEKFCVLLKFGFTTNQIVKTLLKAPTAFIRPRTSTGFISVINYLQSIEFSDQSITSIILKCPWILSNEANIQRVMWYLQTIFTDHGYEADAFTKAKAILRTESMLFTQAVSKIEQNISVLLSHGFNGENLIKVIDNCPYSLRCRSHTLTSKLTCLQFKLDLDRRQLVDTIGRYSQILEVSVEKIQTNIDFLHSEGISNKAIQRCPTALKRSLALLMERCQILKQVNYHFTSVSVFTKSPKHFGERIEQLCRRKHAGN